MVNILREYFLLNGGRQRSRFNLALVLKKPTMGFLLGGAGVKFNLLAIRPAFETALEPILKRAQWTFRFDIPGIRCSKTLTFGTSGTRSSILEDCFGITFPRVDWLHGCLSPFSDFLGGKTSTTTAIFSFDHFPVPSMTPNGFPAEVTQPDVQSDVPTNANEHCVGTESDQAYHLYSLKLTY